MKERNPVGGLLFLAFLIAAATIPLHGETGAGEPKGALLPNADLDQRSGRGARDVVVARTQGENPGSADLWRVGYYDEDEIADSAFFRHTGGRTFELAAVLSRSPDIVVLAELNSVANMGVKSVGPGMYVTACAKGSGPKCRSRDEESVRLERDGILLIRYESSAQLFYVEGGAIASVSLSD